MKVAPENIQVGDRVRPIGTVRLAHRGGTVEVLFDGGTAVKHLGVGELAHAEITRPEKPLEVGDTVRLRDHPPVYKIAHIIEDRAWIKPVGAGGDMVVHLSSLTRIRETADEAG